MALGDFFPEAVRRQKAEAALTPGTVLYLEVRFPQVTKSKYLVLATIEEPDILIFIVNSEISELVRRQDHLLKCQVALTAAENTFLQHDSQLACHEVFRLKREMVLSELTSDLSRIRGSVSAGTRAQILSAVKFTKTIEPRLQRLIITNFE